jgi:hypothetical protein
MNYIYSQPSLDTTNPPGSPQILYMIIAKDIWRIVGKIRYKASSLYRGLVHIYKICLKPGIATYACKLLGSTSVSIDFNVLIEL